MPRLLLVDDEATLLQLLRRYLEKQGHQVDVAGSAEAGLEVFTLSASTYDLAIADLTLPAMNGEEFIAKLREQRPNLPAILTSGYPHEPQLKNIAFLQKPFLPQMLVEQIAKLLKT